MLASSSYHISNWHIICSHLNLDWPWVLEAKIKSIFNAKSNVKYLNGIPRNDIGVCLVPKMEYIDFVIGYITYVEMKDFYIIHICALQEIHHRINCSYFQYSTTNKQV